MAEAVAQSRRAFQALCVVAAVGLVWSGIGPVDRLTWWLEVAPVIVAVPLLAATLTRFPLTWIVYLLIAVHAAILMLGGHYTYANVPLGFWLQDVLDLLAQSLRPHRPLRAGLRAGDRGARAAAAAYAAASRRLAVHDRGRACASRSAPATSSSSGGRR